MKTFGDYVSFRELASYEKSEKDAENQERDPKSAQAVEIAMRAVQKILESRPEIIIAFLNQQRNEPDIKRMLNDFRLDSFPDVKSKQNGTFNDKGLGDRSGEEEALYPNSADGYKV